MDILTMSQTVCESCGQTIIENGGLAVDHDCPNKVDHRSQVEKYLVPVTVELRESYCNGCLALTNKLFKMHFLQTYLELCLTCYIGLKNGIRESLTAGFRPRELDCGATKEPSEGAIKETSE